MKWEYRVLEIGVATGPKELAGILDSVGADSWELIAVMTHSSIVAIFKRPRQETTDDKSNPQEKTS